jgi:hypothetical protein
MYNVHSVYIESLQADFFTLLDVKNMCKDELFYIVCSMKVLKFYPLFLCEMFEHLCQFNLEIFQ